MTLLFQTNCILNKVLGVLHSVADVNAANSKPGPEMINCKPSPPLRRPPAAPPLGPPPPYATLDCAVIGSPPFNSIPAYAEAVIVSGTLSINTYAIPRFVTNHQSPVDLDLFELPLQKLRFCERLGEGQFGEVRSLFYVFFNQR